MAARAIVHGIQTPTTGISVTAHCPHLPLVVGRQTFTLDGRVHQCRMVDPEFFLAGMTTAMLTSIAIETRADLMAGLAAMSSTIAVRLEVVIILEKIGTNITVRIFLIIDNFTLNLNPKVTGGGIDPTLLITIGVNPILMHGLEIRIVTMVGLTALTVCFRMKKVRSMEGVIAISILVVVTTTLTFRLVRLQPSTGMLVCLR